MNMEFIGWILGLLALVGLTVYMFVNESEQERKDKSFVKWLIKIIMLVVAILLTGYIAFMSF